MTVVERWRERQCRARSSKSRRFGVVITTQERRSKEAKELACDELSRFGVEERLE